MFLSARACICGYACMLVSLPMEVRDSISHSSGDSHPLFSETGSSTTVEYLRGCMAVRNAAQLRHRLASS